MTENHHATYSPEDNKLRLYPASRLDAETYARAKDLGFAWAPKQELFVAPTWTPAREDFLTALCGDIGDEDTTLVERAELRAERFGDYSESRLQDANRAREAVSAIADNIPPGQPILVGHHSERHARKDAERIQNGMRKAVRLWQASHYWTARAKGAIRAAKYKERPDVRARRIKGLEADQRKHQRERDESARLLNLWRHVDEADGPLRRKDGQPGTTMERAVWIANRDHVHRCFPLSEFPRVPPASQYEGMTSLWSALTDGVITADQAQGIAIRHHEAVIADADRWLAHVANRLQYERAMLADAGGTVADRNKPEVGGACRCWASPRGGWSYVLKVNRVSVTVEDNFGNGGKNFTRTMPFDKLHQLMSAAEVQSARDADRLIETDDKTGFYLRAEATAPPTAPAPVAAPAAAGTDPDPAPVNPAPIAEVEPSTSRGRQENLFATMEDTLRQGVQAVTAPQLFPTPPGLADLMVRMAGIQLGHSVLEPSAGTGSLLRAIFRAHPSGIQVSAVEINPTLADGLAETWGKAGGCTLFKGDFLTLSKYVLAGQEGFDRIVMNPPFERGADIHHIRHALDMLRPRGRLVAICANGPRQQEVLRPIAEAGGTWDELPEGTFAGTGVHAVLLVIEKPADLGTKPTLKLTA